MGMEDEMVNTVPVPGIVSKTPVRGAAPVATVPVGGPAPASDSRLKQFMRGANNAPTPLVDTDAAKAAILAKENARLAGGNNVNSLAAMVGGVPAGVTLTPNPATSSLKTGLGYTPPPGEVSPVAPTEAAPAAQAPAAAPASAAAGASMTPATDAAVARTSNDYYKDKGVANPTATPAAANVSDPAKLQADQARYDQEQAAYKANPQSGAAAAAEGQRLRDEAAAWVAQRDAQRYGGSTGGLPEAPAAHQFQAGGRLSATTAAMMNSVAANKRFSRDQAAKAPFIKAQHAANAAKALAGTNQQAAATSLANQTQLAQHAQSLKQNDPLHQEQLKSAKGANESAARVSALQAQIADPKGTPEQKAAAKETLRDLAGKQDGYKIATEQTMEGTKASLVSPNGDVEPMSVAEKRTAEKAAKAQRVASIEKAKNEPAYKAARDKQTAAQFAQADAATKNEINEYRVAHGLPKL